MNCITIKIFFKKDNEKDFLKDNEISSYINFLSANYELELKKFIIGFFNPAMLQNWKYDSNIFDVFLKKYYKIFEINKSQGYIKISNVMLRNLLFFNKLKNNYSDKRIVQLARQNYKFKYNPKENIENNTRYSIIKI